MKNSHNFQTRTRMKPLPFLRFLLFFSVLLLSGQQNMLHAQGPKLSIQGILKKANGEAVPDDTYELTFKIYNVETGGTPLWTELQSNVEVISGIYSTVLGNTTPLTIAFNQVYYLGVTVGSTEMTPRIQLTSAPYALSLIGVNNQFPSSGQVIADSIDVNGNVLTRIGAPGLNGVNKNGFGFLGDKDSGLFTTAANRVSLYVNNQEKVRVTADSVVINGEARPENIRLDNGGKVSYNGLDDWRLVETDYLETDAEGWKVYNPTNGVQGAWNNGSGVAATVTSFSDDFAGKALVQSTQGQVFKKQFTPPGSSVAGSYTFVKVVFRYYFLDSWDLAQDEVGWAGFSKTENCTEISLGWYANASYVSNGNNFPPAFGQAASFQGNATYSDQWRVEEMVGRFPSGPGNTNFWVVFGYNNQEAVATETFGVGMIEIWVK